MQIDLQFHKLLKAKIAFLEKERQPYQEFWSEIADFYLPKRYVWLDNVSARVRSMRNTKILDSTGTNAARVLASGMMNGITSPARPWFSLRITGQDDTVANSAVRVWLDEVTRRMAMVISASNFYNAIATLYLDLVTFGTGAMLIYEDYKSVIHCCNPSLGEYYLAQDDRGQVATFARKFQQTVEQIVMRFGEENVCEATKNLWKKGGAAAQQQRTVCHMLEPNVDGKGKVNKRFPYRETYWEDTAPNGTALSQKGYFEVPGLFVRWELSGNDAYGTSPAMDALGDVKQLQQETLRKAQGIDKMINPPIVADIQLQHRPTATIPGGMTYVAGANSVGAKPLYQIAPPLGELSADIQNIQNRIRETLHNPLFQMISQLDTVRSAAEIDARREEKLVLLGPVLERFENEALDPSIKRTFAIMQRAGLLPDPPPEMETMDIEIQYVSILSTAQMAIAAAPTERWIGLIGNIAAARPEVLNIPNWEELVRNYGRNLGVRAKDMNPPEVSAQQTAQQNQATQTAQVADVANTGASAAQQLSATDVGGGANALQMLLGG